MPSNAEGAGLIPGYGAKIPHALQPKQTNKKNIKQKQYCNKFNKDLKKRNKGKENLSVCTWPIAALSLDSRNE